jgi:hypothetical protein
VTPKKDEITVSTLGHIAARKHMTLSAWTFNAQKLKMCCVS